MYYIAAVALFDLLLIAVNFVFSSVKTLPLFFKLIGLTVYGTAAAVALDALTALIIRKLPEKWFGPDGKAFAVGKGERKFYKKIRLQRIRDKVPELGGLTGFHKDRLASATDSEYLRRFLLEADYGMTIHFVNALCGIVLPFLPFLNVLSVSIPLALLNAVLSLLPMFLLRNNTPMLLKLYHRAADREKNEGQDSESV
ncbi:MAG: hypothetical protein MJ137_03725 [Clostridia bacterium]|nr:hypothetical protein [Clostridia bacterium]